jgi:elongation factor Tu
VPRPTGNLTTADSIECFGEPRAEARAGDDVSLYLRAIPSWWIRRRVVVVQPQSATGVLEGEVDLEVADPVIGRHTAFRSGSRPHFWFGALDVTAVLEVDGDVLPGDRVRARVVFARAVPVEVGDRFVVREGGRTVGSGVVLRLGAPTGSA